MSRWILGILVPAFVTMTWSFSDSRPQTAQRAPIATGQPNVCSGTLMPWEFPEAVPDYLAWESFFDDVTRSESAILNTAGLTPAAIEAVKGHATQALSSAGVARTAPQLPVYPSRDAPATDTTTTRSRATPISLSRDASAAAAILRGRDQLIRELPEPAFRVVNESSQASARHRVYRLSAPGESISTLTGPQCRVTVKGREYPHLVPEAEYWAPHFRIYAQVSTPYRIGVDDYQPTFLDALQKNQLHIPIVHLRRFLNIANNTAASLDQAREARATESEIGAIVMRAREELIRSFPENIWFELQKDASRTCDGTMFTFPLSLDAGR